ncbi:MAG: hypothetical protein M1816_005324 [Peltula sp. TS41687]|nr:MAG: hypothetical protein M1816_005324 [Peltula sp. TS41687]
MMPSLLGDAYASSDEEAKPMAEHTPPPSIGPSTIDAAPDVSLEVSVPAQLRHSSQSPLTPEQDPSQLQLALATTTSKSLSYNVPYDDLTRAALGPTNPFKPSDGGMKRKNLLTGYAEEAAVSEATFNTQHRTFQSLGYSRDPGVDGGFVGDLASVERYGGRDVVQLRPSREKSEAIRRKRQKRGDASIVEGEGAYRGPWARYRDDEQAEEDEAALAGEQLASDEEYEEEAIVSAAAADLPAAPLYSNTKTGTDDAEVEKTEFHGAAQFDYQGRTYMHVPQDLGVDLRKDVGSVKNYVPKKVIHVWKEHGKAITALRFFPRSGHILLSASADTKIKIWDVYHDRDLLRTNSGHTKAVTDLSFNHDGTRFLSASYDRHMKLWDTEYGTCISRFSTGKIPHVVAFHPAEPHTHEFLAGMSDKKIIQYDTRSGQLTQEYDHHLGAINTITFVDGARRFITTSDDKSLRAWEYNIPVPIKFIAEPYMFSMVRACLHPSGKYVALQSADNQIVVYAATDKFRQNRKKAFRGHHTAGHAIDVDISPDGNFIASGDESGYVCFWDFKNCKMLHKISTGDAPVLCARWHPQETSKFVTGGLDGVIRYFD